MSAMTTLPVVADMLKKNTVGLMNALPKISGLSADRLIRVALTEFTKNPRLAECTPISFCSAVMQAAQMGLEFGELKHCALVPYKNEIKLMVQWQGWVALLWRAKVITDIQARVVYEGDTFEVSYGTSTTLLHKPAFKSSRPTMYYALATPTNGQPMFEIMSYDQVEAHMKQYARGLDKKDSPWNTAFDAMALKTVIRKLIKLLPLSSDAPLLTALKTDEQIWEAEVTESRMDKFRAISAAPDIATTEVIEVAAHEYNSAVEMAKHLKIDISDLPSKVDFNDTKKLTAITGIILSRIPHNAPSGREPGDE